MPMNSATRKIVNRNRASSTPRRVRNELSAAPNRPVPCPRTWSRMIATTSTEMDYLQDVEEYIVQV